jgi:hypothetical protein
MKTKIKIISTAYRVLYLLLLLNEKNMSLQEILSIFSEDECIEKDFSQEVIFKYISTLRQCGYDIARPLDKLIAINAKTKMSKPLICPKQAKLIEKFEQCLAEEKRIILKYKTFFGEDSTYAALEPKGIKYNSHMTGLSGYNHISGEMQMISLENVEEIEELPLKSKNSVSLSPVIFKLNSRLARGYRLYEDENVQSRDENEKTLTVVSYAEDKNILLKRLLKYGDYCEILYPQSLREKAVSTINNALRNY